MKVIKKKAELFDLLVILKTYSNHEENNVGATQRTFKSNLLDILYIHLSVADHFTDLFKTAKSAKNHCLNSCDKLSQK